MTHPALSRSVTATGGTVRDAAAVIAAGGMAVVLDDTARENEADLIMAAESATVDAVAFFVEHTSGLLCVPMPREHADRLGLPPMVDDNTDVHQTAFLRSVDLRGAGTGISAIDRSATIRALADARSTPADFTSPGHTFPLAEHRRGLAARAGHTEAGVALCRIAGCTPVALICELVSADRRDMLRGEDAHRFAARHGLPVITVGQLEEFQRLRPTGNAPVPTAAGRAHAYAYASGGVEHLAMVYGDIAGRADVLVRIHSECLTGDLFASRRCDCGEQLAVSVAAMVAAGGGVVVYLTGHEGRGIGLGRKLLAYRRQAEGLDTVDANTSVGAPVDARDYAVAGQILAHLGVEQAALLTNNPDKVRRLEDQGIPVSRRVPLETVPTLENIRYLRTKRDRLGHLLADLPEETQALG
ncbi:3,4-dihydroxy-2-butanone-4-phosphate synthase [Gordonia sp. PP30]|uniref:3,4-dihydroxy-2-butanone-4-phosphate synthase n=1 Tax=Gordonia sp. PP30 TaxID=2935861 RepID=UPI001FFF6B75|nr:3,4-dihydroxy-2-butanone-4-phosphate synthase [Gordonia sp. PP30]UQE74008.1 3,4-dihydroxy-2-butanone-4-phosphate synthase [Gordonia sp. PP30]